MIQISNSVALVVDDDEGICDLLETVLAEEGFSVIKAHSGEEALAVFSENVVDIVFTDIRMGGISGFELLSRITSMDKTVKVIIMTGFSGYDAVLKALRAGAYEYISKPLEDLTRIAAIARKAHEHVMLARDNEILVAKLKASYAKLANANDRLVILNKQLRKLAVTDSLTGMYNRRYVDLTLAKQFEQYVRYKDPFSVLMLDIDHFKQFNDVHGHDGGDQALCIIAKLIQDSARATDVVGRYGGEEFYMLLSNTPPENGKIVAERIRTNVASSRETINGKTIELTVSIGVSGLDGKEELTSLRELTMRADKALYLAKEMGRNQVQMVNHTDLDPDSDTGSIKVAANS